MGLSFPAILYPGRGRVKAPPPSPQSPAVAFQGTGATQNASGPRGDSSGPKAIPGPIPPPNGPFCRILENISIGLLTGSPILI